MGEGGACQPGHPLQLAAGSGCACPEQLQQLTGAVPFRRHVARLTFSCRDRIWPLPNFVPASAFFVLSSVLIRSFNVGKPNLLASLPNLGPESSCRHPSLEGEGNCADHVCWQGLL